MNVARIKRILNRAINQAPTTITLKRYTMISDGIGGYTSSAISTIATVTGLMSTMLTSIRESGKGVDKKPTLIIEYTSSFTPTKGDFFSASNINYRVLSAYNILNLNIFWECELEIIKET